MLINVLIITDNTSVTHCREGTEGPRGKPDVGLLITEEPFDPHTRAMFTEMTSCSEQRGDTHHEQSSCEIEPTDTQHGHTKRHQNHTRRSETRNRHTGTHKKTTHEKRTERDG